MITVLLLDMYSQVITRRYDTNLFDEAVHMLVDDWISGVISWDDISISEAFTPEWLRENGYPCEDVEPDIDETEIVHYRWHWPGETESDDQIVDAFMVKSSQVQDHEWPTKGVWQHIF